MEIEFYFEKSVEENAGNYFAQAKKAKKKLEGAKVALAESQQKYRLLLESEQKFFDELEKKRKRPRRERAWYHKFHWFYTSTGELCIGGKDATTNEMVIKKYVEPDDLVFHTDMAGSPFFVLKSGKNAPESCVLQAAQATAVHSRAWKLGHTQADVFYVLPDQVTKEAQSGEHLGKGSFMIYGKTTYLHPALEWAIGVKDGLVVGGPIDAIRPQTTACIVIIPGDEKKSSLAKKILHLLGDVELDDIVTFLPAGGGQLKEKAPRKKR